MEVGTKVLAIKNTFGNKVYVIGEGTYLGEKVPDQIPFNMLGVENPCIALGSGKFTWGFQCWWGPKDSAERKFSGMEFEQLEGEELEAYTSVKPFRPEKETSNG